MADQRNHLKMQQELDQNYDEKQESQLRNHAIIYKQLLRNPSIEADRPLTAPSKEAWEHERERLFHNAVRYYHEKVEKNEDLKAIARERWKQRPPESELPDAPIFSERMQSYVDRRRQEIEAELKRTSSSDPRYTALKVEMLFINSRDFYTKLREAIISPLVQEEQQAVLQSRMLERLLLDRNYFRRDKPIRRHENKLSDRFELNMIRHEQARRKRIKQKEFMQAVFAHQIEFFEFHRKKYKHVRKCFAQAKAILEQKDSKVQQKLREARIHDIKTGDLESFLKKVEEAKRARVMEILQQTDKFLKDIGARVKIQKGDEIQDDDELVDTPINNNNDPNYDLLKSNRIYYKVTHKIQEEISQQPSLLEGGKLKDYQIAGLNWLVSLYNNKLNGILADEMGLGKTIQTISLMCYLIEVKKNFGPFLIIVPLSTLSNWSNEFEKWAPSIKKLTYKGSPAMRKEIAKQMKSIKWNICLTTYEYILKDRLTLSKYDWGYIIVDEGHRMKNYRSKFASVLGQQYQSERRLLLTGTPLQNNMAELWALLNFLLPKVFSSCEDFEKWFTTPLNRMGANEKDCTLDEEEQLLIINRLHQVLRPFLLRRVKKDVESQLPKKVEYVIKIELSAWQQKIYNQVKQRGVVTFDQKTGKLSQQALQNLMMQLRKICNHPYMFIVEKDLSRVTDEIWRSSGKFELLDRILPKLLHFQHRILIFCQMTTLMDIMEAYFELKGWKYLRLDGSTKSEDREARIQSFNSENSIYNIFLLSTRAGGLGLNLQSADTVIIFDSDWNPMMDLQAQDRAYRIGQKNEVRVFRLVTNTQIEEDILSKAEHKMGLDQVIIQAGLFNQRSTDMERKERLQEFFRSKNNKEYEQDEIPDDEQINDWIARTDEEREEFNRMDKQRYELEKHAYKHFKYPSPEEAYFNYRLIQEDEVPPWIMQKQTEVQEIKEYGRGNRTRRQVNYNDESSDYEEDQIQEEYDIVRPDDDLNDEMEQESANLDFPKKKKKLPKKVDDYEEVELEPKPKPKRKLN